MGSGPLKARIGAGASRPGAFGQSVYEVHFLVEQPLVYQIDALANAFRYTVYSSIHVHLSGPSGVVVDQSLGHMMSLSQFGMLTPGPYTFSVGVGVHGLSSQYHGCDGFAELRVVPSLGSSDIAIAAGGLALLRRRRGGRTLYAAPFTQCTHTRTGLAQPD